MQLNIMLVTSADKQKNTIVEGIKQSGFSVTSILGVMDDLYVNVEMSDPDCIIIDLKNPNSEYLEQIRKVNRELPKPVVMFSESAEYDVIEEVVKSGVHAYIVDGLDLNRIKPIVETAMLRFNEFQKLRNQLNEAQTSLKDRKNIDIAKGLLMEHKNMSESEAYKKLRKMAMDQNKKMGEIAENVISMFRLLS